MATGGTIPSNRTQSVTFYNTTGVIEREKNMYYVPRFNKVGAQAGQQVRQVWLNAFTQVCPPSSDYESINISSWSPQDRVLKIQGNVDDFRLVTDEGDCLNYFIITRSISKTSGETTTTQIHYYGFFITGVRQSGGSTIEITCEPDDFTNVFYLHNKYVLTNIDYFSYEPFNEKMKNCYVNRQHYNRIKNPRVNRDYRSYFDIISGYSSSGFSTFLSSCFAKSIEIKAFENGVEVSKGTFYVTDHPSTTSLSLTQLTTVSTNVVNLPTKDSNNQVIRYKLYNLTDETSFDGVTILLFQHRYPYDTYYYDTDHQSIFLNQEETFKYKYQYRDLKYPISDYSYNVPCNFTDTEMSNISRQSNFDNLSTALKTKIILSCIMFLVVETKSMEKIGDCNNVISGEYTNYMKYHYGGELVSGVELPNIRVAFPELVIPQVFKKYEAKIKTLATFYARLEEGDYIAEPILTNANYYLLQIQETAMTTHFYSMYYVRDIGMSDNISVRFTGDKGILIRLDYPYSFPYDHNVIDLIGVETPHIIPLAIKAENVSNYDGITAVWSYNPDTQAHSMYRTVFDTDHYAFGLSFNTTTQKKNIMKLHDTFANKNLILNYEDPVLEAEPYSFFSISTLGSIELPLYKNRYYNSLVEGSQKYYQFDIYYYLSINGAVKVSYIPSYTVEGIETKYFNEGLVFTVASSIPMSSNSYDEYYYQNKAQMKNQFAVMDYNYITDITQKEFLTAPNEVGKMAFKAGGAGAIVGIANETIGLLNDTIDYSQSRAVLEANQQAKLADMGARPDTLKQVGSDVIYDIKSEEMFVYLNHYTIDKISHDSICKLLERIGYQVNLYDSLNVKDRVGWNFIKLNSFDWSPDVNIMTSQEETIKQIFKAGVTLLHDKTYLTSGHNFETILE